MSTSVKGKPSCARGENTAPAAVPARDSVPQVCRCCGGALDIQWQSSGLTDKPGYWLMTCWNRACGLFAVTRTHLTYATFDVSLYLNKERLND